MTDVGGLEPIFLRLAPLEPAAIRGRSEPVAVVGLSGNDARPRTQDSGA